MKLKNSILLIMGMIMMSMSFAQKSVKQEPKNASSSELFGRDWVSFALSVKLSENINVENAFPTYIHFEQKGNEIYRSTYFITPGTLDDTLVQSIDTFNLNKETIAYSKSGRKIISTTRLSEDKKSVNFIRVFYNATDPSIKDFTYNETYRILDNGDMILEKESVSDDPNSSWNFVGEKRYPKDSQKGLVQNDNS